MSLRLPKLYLKCKTCGATFWTEIRFIDKIFWTLDFDGHSHVCPNGHKHQYGKKDYHNN